MSDAREVANEINEECIDLDGEWNDRDFTKTTQIIAAALAQQRLEEARWWADHDIEDLDTQDQWDEIARERIATLEREAGTAGKGGR